MVFLHRLFLCFLLCLVWNWLCPKSITNPEFGNSVIRLHNLVGNAAIEDRYILVGAGSSQLYQVVLYAPSKTNSSEPMSVVSAAPFYSSYPLMTDYLKSGLYRWAGDAYKFNTDEPYIELVTSLTILTAQRGKLWSIKRKEY